MGGKSSIERLPEPVKKRIQQLLRENRLTLEGLVSTLQTEFPEQAGAGEIPSKSSLHRYSSSIKTIVAREREIAVAAEALVGELGENFDSKAGALLAQSVTTLANRCAFDALERTDGGKSMEIGDVLDLARAAKTVQEARSLNLRERHAVAEYARKQLLQEQDAKLKAMGNKGGVTDEAKRAIREALGIA